MPSRPCLEWRCRRGTKELDLLLQAWLAEAHDRAGAAERQAFVRLLEWPDDALGRLLLGQARAEDPELDALARHIRALSPPRP
jgi:antitoxin CptB